MKKLVVGFLAMISLALTACPGGNSGNNNNGNVIAETPIDPRCLNGTTYCPQYNYNQYRQYGWMAYPHYYYNGYAATGAFCSCPSGYTPTYHSSWGLGCVSNSYASSLFNYAVYWNTYAYFGNYAYGTVSSPVYSNNSSNIPQVSNISNANYGTSCNYGNNLSQTCFVNQANSCGINARCAPTASGSPIGLCISTF